MFWTRCSWCDDAWSGRGRRGNRQTQQSRACWRSVYTHYEERWATQTLYLCYPEVSLPAFSVPGFCLSSFLRFSRTKQWQFVRSCTWRASLCHFLGGSEALRCPLISHRSLARISTSIRPSPSTPKVTHFLAYFSQHATHTVHMLCVRAGCVLKPSALPT